MNSTINKAIMLDNCVDGDETRFGNLVGKDYDEFIATYEFIKKNCDKLDIAKIKCNYSDDETELEFRIPTIKKINMKKLNVSMDRAMNTKIDKSVLIINVSVKKGW